MRRSWLSRAASFLSSLLLLSSPAAAQTPPTVPATVKVTWLGTAGLYVSDGKSSFLVDPFVSRYGLARVLTRMALEPKMELIEGLIKKLAVPQGTPVLVSHSHYDHALDAPYFADKLHGKLIGSGSTVFVGLGAGLKQSQMQLVAAGETLRIGDFQIKFVASCHGPQFAGLELWTGAIEAPFRQPAGAFNYKVGDHFSLAVTHPGGSFFHQASACIKPGMYDGVHADTLFLGIAARDSTLGLVDPALRALGARQLVPIHWDDFFSPLSEGAKPGTGSRMDEFRQTMKAERPLIRVTELGYGDSLSL
jgi:L-ascorbate metabolism protein UlaG (beta-lactamase superfamily)